MELHSYFSHLPSDIQVFHLIFESSADDILHAHLYLQSPHSIDQLHCLTLPNLLPVHHVQNASSQVYQMC